jgi:SAM-dependent methyltransferase
VSTLNAEGVRALLDAVGRLEEKSAAVERQLRLTQALLGQQSERVGRLMREVEGNRRAAEAEDRIIARLTRFARTRLPIVLGPWTGDPAFELLYWIPFLQWVREAFPIDPDRLVVVSRGGVAQWYSHVTSHYADIAQYASPDELEGFASIDRRPQLPLAPFDCRIIRNVMRDRGLRHAHVLHPGLVYGLHRVAARQGRLDAFLRFKSFDRPLPAAVPPLPQRFVAVHFSFNEGFPGSSENRWLAGAIVSALAARGDVVLLNSRILEGDGDFASEPLSRVHVLGVGVGREEALAVQTAVISRADAFVGSYGSAAFLAPLCGVSSLMVYSKRTFRPEDLALAQRAFPALGSARLTAIDAGQADLVSNALWAWMPGHRLTASADEAVALLRLGLQALPRPERLHRVAAAEKQASSPAVLAAVADLRSELAEAALAELSSGWGDLPLKEGISRLESKWMRAALSRAARDARDRRVVQLMAGSRGPEWEGAIPLTGFGVGFDERVLELPFALDTAGLDRAGEVLDAGSSLNLPVVRQVVGRPAARLTHFTQSGSRESQLPGDEDKFVFRFGDLRQMPFADRTFDRAVCVSTLEHVGMDNTQYGGASEADPASAVRAVAELLRVIVPGGELLLTVPYGRRRATESFRVFDADDLRTLLAPAAADEVQTRYFYYQSGWTEGNGQPPAAVLDARYSDDVVTGIAVTRIRRRGAGR